SPVRRDALLTTLRRIVGLLRDSQDVEKNAATKETIRVPQFAARVLLAEDDQVNQLVATRFLQSFGCTITVAEDGKKAIDLFESKPSDLVFMDCHMPEVDGFEATRRIRAEEGDETRTPIIALTANAMQGDREKCLAAGMDDYLSKPLQK